MNGRLLLYERLAQDYITLGEMTQVNSYFEEAVKVFEEIRTMNWDTWLTFSNAIVLCQRVGDLEGAEAWALEMLTKYPEHYVTYMRLAFLEAEKIKSPSSSCPSTSSEVSGPRRTFTFFTTDIMVGLVIPALDSMPVSSHPSTVSSFPLCTSNARTEIGRAHV